MPFWKRCESGEASTKAPNSCRGPPATGAYSGSTASEAAAWGSASQSASSKLGIETAKEFLQRLNELAHFGTHRLGKARLRMGWCQVPQPQRHLRHGKAPCNVATNLLWQCSGIGSAEQTGGPGQQAAGQQHVFGAMPDHLHDAVLQHLDLVTQHLGLAL